MFLECRFESNAISLDFAGSGDDPFLGEPVVLLEGVHGLGNFISRTRVQIRSVPSRPQVLRLAAVVGWGAAPPRAIE